MVTLHPNGNLVVLHGRIERCDLVHGRFLRALVELGVGAVFALIGWGQARAVREQTAHLRAPPLSTVTNAFDFSDDQAPLFESRRFECTMRDARFAS